MGTTEGYKCVSVGGHMSLGRVLLGDTGDSYLLIKLNESALVLCELSPCRHFLDSPLNECHFLILLGEHLAHLDTPARYNYGASCVSYDSQLADEG